MTTTDRRRDRSQSAPRAAADACDSNSSESRPQPVARADRSTPVPRAGADASDAPLRRSGRGTGYPHKAGLDHADGQLRRALSRLARDVDPDARRAGAQLAQEATAALSALADRADRASTAWKRQQDRVRRLGERLDRQLARRRASTSSPDLDPPPAA